jgi:hypothetical protein
VAVLLLIGSIPFFLGLAVVMPVLGHATWHLYRRAVEPDPNPHPDYVPRDRTRRSAADFPAALFPTRNNSTRRRRGAQADVRSQTSGPRLAVHGETRAKPRARPEKI